MVNQTSTVDGAAIIEGLLQSIEHKSRVRGAAGTPANDPPVEDINDESHINEAVPCADIGEVRDPQDIVCPIVGKTIPQIVF